MSTFFFDFFTGINSKKTVINESIIEPETNTKSAQIENIKSHLTDYGFQIHESKGELKTILGAR